MKQRIPIKFWEFVPLTEDTDTLSNMYVYIQLVVVELEEL